MKNAILCLSLLIVTISILLTIIPEILISHSKKCRPTITSNDPYHRHTITLKDGRSLEYSIYGDIHSDVVVFSHHGFPQTSISGFLLDTPAKSSGVKLIVPARPGLGLSQFKELRTIGDFADDVIELADALGVGKFGVVGASGGGPYTLAAAALIPKDRLVDSLVICGIGPKDTVPDALEGMTSANKFMFSLPIRISSLLGYTVSQMISTEMELPEQMTKDLVPKDKAIMESFTPEMLKLFLADMKEATTCGIAGIHHDHYLMATYAEWGFSLKDITDASVTIIHGVNDENVPVSHAKWVHEQIPSPNKSLILEQDEGHFSILYTEQVYKFYERVKSRV